MNITVYLPEDLGNEAKAANLNLSGMLREGVQRELARRKSMAELTEVAEEQLLELENADGIAYTGRFRGVLLAEGRNGKHVFSKEDGRVLVYDEGSQRFWEYDPEQEADRLGEELRGMLKSDEYLDVMDSLGLDAVVDL